MELAISALAKHTGAVAAQKRAKNALEQHRLRGPIAAMARRELISKGGVAALCLAVAGLGLIYRFVGDRNIWGAWLSVAPPIIWVGLLLPSAIGMRSWIAGAFLAAFLLFNTEWPRFGCGESSVQDTIRLVSWNIGAGNTNYLEPLTPYRPDIVLIQEGMTPSEIWEGFEWYGTLDPCILSRFSAKVLPTHKVGPWTEPQLLLVEIKGKKVLLANVRLLLPSAVIQIVSPFEEDPIENYRARIEQYDRLAKLLQSTAKETGVHSIILAGDFNVPARWPSLDPFRKFLADVWLAEGRGWSATVPEFLPLSRVDQVWISDDIRPVCVRTVHLAGSDHRGLVVDLAIGN